MIVDEQSARAWIEKLPGCDDAAFDRLSRLIALLDAENTRQNLVSASSLSEVWLRHIADSAQLLSHLPREASGSWLDLGTGAGFPGLVITILRPDIRVVMVESRTQRIRWLEQVVTGLELTNAEVIGSRLELVPTQKFAVISARAFAPLERLLELSARFSTVETNWVLPKGRSAAQELRELRGWDHMFHVEQSLTDADAGIIIGRLNGRTRKTS